jgi:flagellar motility protein MotE (MotC chaperone)
MAEEQDIKSEESEEVTPSAKTEKSKLPILIGAVGTLIFVLFVAIFSISMGVFSSSNVTPDPHQQTETDAIDASKKQSKDSDSYAGFDKSYYDDVNAIIDSDPSDSNALSTEDSLAHLAWYEKQKREIDSERRKLEVARTENEELRYETMKLLEERKNIEEANTSQMAKLFDSMKADKVAEIMKNMSDDQVGMILMKMKKQNASKVFAEIPADRAARITLHMINLAEGY